MTSRVCVSRRRIKIIIHSWVNVYLSIFVTFAFLRNYMPSFFFSHWSNINFPYQEALLKAMSSAMHVWSLRRGGYNLAQADTATGMIFRPPLQWRPKVNFSKFRKQIFLFSFEPKHKQNYFLISALASKNGSNQKNECTLLY